MLTCTCATHICVLIVIVLILSIAGALTAVWTAMQGSNNYSVLLEFTERTNIDVLILGMLTGCLHEYMISVCMRSQAEPMLCLLAASAWQAAHK